ncbi:3-phenylpropionate/cinnamic acid dioxygenase subunit beta [Paraburkholderia silviterrae]|uniref:3-phenylpropionate/cinnamic acid dioxygenase subunit beta n=1 Tax=Paraburkholderia silviterrae TaxID=2528715 RepID=A0A4R5M5X1_9BURK|nr:3-phenylpropionate/cinnamic acid dioxygenase subunit beta [Paraburkholderia silviterrae]TDG21443.1 3-phenylpropionate/cinnamic acid dioxygenase subunit beta [Paraburkholderia silviterrae]
MSETAAMEAAPVGLPHARVPHALHHEIEQFLFDEAALLDEWRFRDWLDLMAQDIHYTMRTTVNAQTRDRRRGVQPPTTWIFNDTHFQLERRVARLETGMAWAEEPPSRTRHLVTNLRVRPTASPNEYEAHVNYLLYRAQKERDETIYVGRRIDRVRRMANAGVAPGWQVCRREIALDQAVLSSHNLSVLF